MTMSAERPRLLVPGLLPADPALERYRVHPGAVTAVELDPGDVLTVIDAEGRQRGELTVLAGGAEDYGALGTEADTPPPSSGAMAARSAVTGSLAGTGARSRPGAGRGAVRRVVAGRDTRPSSPRGGACTAVVAAPGGPMSVAADNPPSDLVLEVRRVSPRRPEQRPLPPPLADPAARPAGGHRLGTVLRGQGRPVHPGDRRRGPPVLRLPRVLRPAAGRAEPNAAWTPPRPAT